MRRRLREFVLVGLLGVAGALIAAGAWFYSPGAGSIVVGLALAGLALLSFAEVGE